MKTNDDKLSSIIVITFMLFNGKRAQNKQVVSTVYNRALKQDSL